MIEGGRLPGSRGVALLAERGKPGRYVIRIAGVLKVLLVAGIACRAGQIVVVVDVAIDASSRRVRVPARQRKARRGVIELRVQPVVGRVALVARRAEPRCLVVRRRTLELCRVARIAHRGHDLELAVGRVFVAGIAIDRCVCPR